MDDQKDNYNPYKKISQRGNQSRTIFQPLSELKYNFLSYYKKEELMDLARENFNIYQRLNAKNSSYTLNSHLRDYEKNQYYKKNYCKYPSIDFYRTSKSSNSCSIFNYCTFNNYNHINNEFAYEQNKKKYRTIHKNKSVSEIFNNINKQRQKKINNIVNNHYDLKHYYEDNKKDDEKEKNDEKEKEKEKIDDNYYNNNNIYIGNKEKIKNEKNINNKKKEINNNNKEEEKEEDLILLKDKLKYGDNELIEEKRPINDKKENNDNKLNNENKEIKNEMNQDKNLDNENNEKENNKNEVKEKVENKVKANDDDDIISDIMEDIDI